jgi:hypothetical protein
MPQVLAPQQMANQGLMITTGAQNTTHECFRVAFCDILVAHRIFGTQIWLYIAVVCQMCMYMQV